MSSTDKPRRGWFKSTFSDSSNNCVEVVFGEGDGDMVLVRDSKYSGPADLQPTIAIPAAAWGAFLALALGGDVEGDSIAIPSISTDRNGTVIRDAGTTALEFTPAEWAAFVAGVRAGEFSPATV